MESPDKNSFENRAQYSEDILDDLQFLAQNLAELSVYSERYPDSVPKQLHSADEFNADEVYFDRGTWASNIVLVQGWLSLASELSESSSPLAIANELFNQLSQDNTIEYYRDCEGYLTLTEDGIELLSARVEKALSLKQAFLDALDEGKKLSQASIEWRENWEEDLGDTAHYVSNVSAEVDTWPIMTFKDMARTGLLDLNPTYQRDVVWTNKYCTKLIESVLRGIPLPSIILSRSENSDIYQIVDGKQRLTSILRFMGEHPEGTSFIKSLSADIEEFHNSYRKFYTKNRLKPQDVNQNFLPFKLGKFKKGDPLEQLSGKYYSEIKDFKVEIGGRKTTVKSLFDMPSRDYMIPTITYSETSPQDIHIVFSLYNKQGLKLNAEELRNAAYNHLDLTRLLLGISGDRTKKDVLKELLPFIPEDMLEKFSDVGEILKSKGFGTARFKRTKVISWALSIFLQSPNTNNDAYVCPSTASHISSLLQIISDTRTHILRDENVLLQLANDIVDSVYLHEEYEEFWPPIMRNKKHLEGKWEELPLVACLLGLLILVASQKATFTVEDIDRVREHFSSILLPEKTQNKTQWQFISTLAIDFIKIFTDDLESIERELESRYGYSCINVLQYQSSARKDFYAKQS